MIQVTLFYPLNASHCDCNFWCYQTEPRLALFSIIVVCFGGHKCINCCNVVAIVWSTFEWQAAPVLKEFRVRYTLRGTPVKISERWANLLFNCQIFKRFPENVYVEFPRKSNWRIPLKTQQHDHPESTFWRKTYSVLQTLASTCNIRTSRIFVNRISSTHFAHMSVCCDMTELWMCCCIF